MNLEGSLHSLLSFAWTLTRPTNFNLLRKNIVVSYSERIPVSFSWLFHCFSFFLLLFYVINNFYKNYFVIIILLYIFFMKIIFIFPCSGMFRDVPECSVFLVLSTAVMYSAAGSFVFAWDAAESHSMKLLKSSTKERPCKRIE